VLENIGNTVSLDPLYRGLVILPDWSLSRLASNGLIVRIAKSKLSFIFNLLSILELRVRV